MRFNRRPPKPPFPTEIRSAQSKKLVDFLSLRKFAHRAHGCSPLAREIQRVVLTAQLCPPLLGIGHGAELLGSISGEGRWLVRRRRFLSSRLEWAASFSRGSHRTNSAAQGYSSASGSALETKQRQKGQRRTAIFSLLHLSQGGFPRQMQLSEFTENGFYRSKKPSCDLY